MMLNKKIAFLVSFFMFLFLILSTFFISEIKYRDYIDKLSYQTNNPNEQKGNIEYQNYKYPTLIYSEGELDELGNRNLIMRNLQNGEEKIFEGTTAVLNSNQSHIYFTKLVKYNKSDCEDCNYSKNTLLFKFDLDSKGIIQINAWEDVILNLDLIAPDDTFLILRGPGSVTNHYYYIYSLLTNTTIDKIMGESIAFLNNKTLILNRVSSDYVLSHPRPWETGLPKIILAYDIEKKLETVVKRSTQDREYAFCFTENDKIYVLERYSPSYFYNEGDDIVSYFYMDLNGNLNKINDQMGKEKFFISKEKREYFVNKFKLLNPALNLHNVREVKISKIDPNFVVFIDYVQDPVSLDGKDSYYVINLSSGEYFNFANQVRNIVFFTLY